MLHSGIHSGSVLFAYYPIGVWCVGGGGDGLHSKTFLCIFFQRSRVQVWLYEQTNLRIEGCIAVSISVSVKQNIPEDLLRSI